jgi:flagellar hook-length control protein FliK
VQAAAPVALLSQTTNDKKTPGAAGKALALLASQKNGTAGFWRLLSARTDTKDGKAPDLAHAEALKKGLSLHVKAPIANAQKPSTQAAPAKDMAAKKAAAQDDKAATAKKTARAQSAWLKDGSQVAAQPAVLSAGAPKRTATPDESSKQNAPAEARTAAASTRIAARQAEPVVRVVDLRKKQDASPREASSTAHKPSAVPSTDATDISYTQRLGTLRDAGAEAPQKPAAAAQPQTALERLREMAGSELMKATNLILKDGGGEIRLVLKPESLGSVRIRMNIVDNAIEGKIIVDNSAVKHVIDGSIDALRRAFTAEGFQTASLSVSVGGQNSDAGEKQQRQDAPAAVRRITAQGFERNVPSVENLSMGDLLVNLFA